MSLSSILSVARQGLNAQQTVIQTAGHNISNVETPGYSRQRVDLAANYPQTFSYGSIGTGVVIENIRRMRDELLDVSYRKESGGAAASSLRQDLLSSIEGVLGEPSDTGLAAAMDAFWSSWSDLASNPTSGAARSVVQQRGVAVASMLNSFDSQLNDVRTQTSLQLTNALTEVNGLSDSIADLNARIVEAEVGGTMANDLRDQRDLAIDKLSQFGDVRVLPRNDGSVQVLVGTTSLVDGIGAQHLEIVPGTAELKVRVVGQTEAALPVGGTMQAMMNFLNQDLADTQGRLDALARGLVTEVNAAHRLGSIYASDGTITSAGDFFDRNAVNARDIRLDAAVAGSATAIAAAATPVGGGTTTPSGKTAGPGNNEIALLLAGFRQKLATVTYRPAGASVDETASFADFYRATTSGLGTLVKDAEASTQVHKTLADQADTRRKSISGVNVDEELTTLMRAQQAYAAAAKVISAADEMMKSLIGMI